MIRGKFCVVRTNSAGVHVGTIHEQSGTAAYLTDARRIWSWEEANSLHEIALHGVGKNSKISECVPLILLTQVIEIIPCSEKAEANLTQSRWAK